MFNQVNRDFILRMIHWRKEKQRRVQQKLREELKLVADMQKHYSALKLKVDSLGAMHPSTAVTLVNIGTVYKALADYDKALDFFSRAVDMAPLLCNGGKYRLCVLGRHYAGTA